ncbi:hypothetical protein Q4S25_17540 [Morganella morganii]
MSDKFHDNSNDYILTDVSNWADNGSSIPISISVKGVIYSGMAIGGKEWCLRNMALFDNQNVNDNFKSGITDYFNSVINSVYSDENLEKNDTPQFVHMVVRYMSTYPSGGAPESLWRFRVSEVDAFMFGELKTN